jgi:hypothetical protein
MGFCVSGKNFLRQYGSVETHKLAQSDFIWEGCRVGDPNLFLGWRHPGFAEASAVPPNNEFKFPAPSQTASGCARRNFALSVPLCKMRCDFAHVFHRL